MKKEFDKQIFQGSKGKVLLELSKSYKGDSRFKLDQRFKDDIEVEKLPEKFKQVVQNDIIQKVSQKKKKIQKQKPLIVTRFEPGTATAQKIIKKAEGIKNYEQGLRRHFDKAKKKAHISKGVDKVKKAEKILEGEREKASEFKIVVKGNRKEAFQSNEFKLFG